jgi:hypothetical protein
MQVAIFEVQTDNGFIGMVSFLSQEVVFTKGLSTESIIGTVPLGGDQIAPSNFTPNPVFVDYLHKFVARHTPALPEFQADVKRQKNGWVYIIDFRTGDVNGAVPPEDIIGAFEVKPNPNYRLFTEKGFFVLHPRLEARLVEEIEALN